MRRSRRPGSTIAPAPDPRATGIPPPPARATHPASSPPTPPPRRTSACAGPPFPSERSRCPKNDDSRARVPFRIFSFVVRTVVRSGGSEGSSDSSGDPLVSLHH